MKIIGSNNSDLTEMNRSALVKILQKREICSRADIAREMGLTQASITKIVAVLMDKGIVSEVGVIKGVGNRRSIGLKLNAERYKVIGVKFNRHAYAVGVFDLSGKVYEQNEFEYCISDDKRDILNNIKKEISKRVKAHPETVAIGMAIPGPYIRSENRIAIMTHMNDWCDVDFAKEFKSEFDKPFFIEQDANAGAMAQWWFGEHTRSPHTLAYLLVGEGVGSGIVEKGNLIRGHLGAAAEIGHVSIDVNGPRCECGNYGCLEMYCSANALLRLARERIPKLFEKEYANRAEACNAVFQAARSGEAAAVEVVENIARYIAYGCVNIINSFNPDCIIIGDVVSQGGELLLPTILKIVKERTTLELHRQVEIKLSKLNVDSTLYGAAAIAMDKVLRNPSEYLAIK